MLYQKECIKNFDGYFVVDAMERDINIFKRELAQRVKRREIISYTIDDVEEDCGWGYSCGIRDFLYSTKIYYTITYRKNDITTLSGSNGSVRTATTDANGKIKWKLRNLPLNVAKTCKQFFRQVRRR